MTTPPTPTGKKPCDCFVKIDRAKLVSRATWVCPDCGDDVSIAYVLYYEVTHPHD